MSIGRARLSTNHRSWHSWRAAVALVGGLLLAACGGGSSPSSSSPAPAPTPPPANSAVVILHAGNFDDTVADGVSLVEFFSPTCSHCQSMEPVVEQLATDFEGRAVVAKVDATVSPALAQAWHVPGYPTFVVLKDGQEHDRWLGATSYANLAGLIRAALNAS